MNIHSPFLAVSNVANPTKVTPIQDVPLLAGHAAPVPEDNYYTDRSLNPYVDRDLDQYVPRYPYA